MGGVGGFVCDMLVRSGIINIDIVDFDVINESNINRQYVANYDTIGLNKTLVMKKKLNKLEKKLNCNIYNLKIDENTINNIDFTKYDYIIDCIDDINAKILIVLNAKKYNKKIISAMGAGNKMTTNFLVSKINKTEMCPLAKKMRYELKKYNINDLIVVYSKEPFIKTENKEIGSIVFTVSSMANKIVEYVIKDIMEE